MKKNSLISLLAGTTVLVASFAIYADDSHFTINVCNKEDIAEPEIKLSDPFPLTNILPVESSTKKLELAVEPLS